MLKSLSIQNYALIGSLHISFDAGFSVISGETGAGKSIILGALSLILGQRADTRQIKQGEAKCVIEGIFNLSAYQLKPFFDALDWVYDGEECILRREIWANGKSRAFVNDSPVYLNDLKRLGERLIDIHSQHQNLSLNDNLYQLNLVDLYAGTEAEQLSYSEALHVFRTAEKTVNDLRREHRAKREEEEFIRFQLAALTEAALLPGEQEELEAELEALTHAEEIKSGLFTATTLLSGEEQSVELLLHAVKEALEHLQRVYPRVSELVTRVDSAYIDLKDVREEASRLFEAVEFEPGRQQLLEDRLTTLYDLQKKHSVTTVEELIRLRDQMNGKLEMIDSLDEQLARMEKEMERKHAAMLAEAERLSKKRRAAMPSFEEELTQQLSYLRMPNSSFRCHFSVREHPDDTGMDHVAFLFSANRNSSLLPVAQIASGGEISRLMLCLKAMIAGATALPTIIFDEIDTGTSGEIADRVGSIMEEMSGGMQVIAITHLPQIASKGKSHLVVYKEETREATITRIKELKPDERVHEIARMLSGAEITAEAIENARVMLE